MSKTILTLLLGIGVGLLIAPAKGSDTWRNMVDGLDDYKGRAEEALDELADKGKKRAGAAKKSVRQAVK